jgi:hypothetical protein
MIEFDVERRRRDEDWEIKEVCKNELIGKKKSWKNRENWEKDGYEWDFIESWSQEMGKS